MLISIICMQIDWFIQKVAHVEVEFAVIRLEMLDPIIQSHFFIAVSGNATKLTKDTIIFMLLQIFQKSFFNTFSKLTFMLNLGNKFFCNQRSRMSNENSTLWGHTSSLGWQFLQIMWPFHIDKWGFLLEFECRLDIQCLFAYLLEDSFSCLPFEVLDAIEYKYRVRRFLCQRIY